MEKTYEPHMLEAHWYPVWEQAGYFAPQESQNAYCIMLPPPNVTGSLHMGHGFQHTLMDALTRYHRMCGDSTLWQPGVDHAGIATQMVVERQLLIHNKSRHDVGREAFVERVWEWKAESGNTITQQMRRMGSSVDWSRERFTMDPEFSDAVHRVFIQLYKEDLIYRGQRLVNWDPVLHTAISDLEVVTQEEQGSLWHIRYPLVNAKDASGNGYIVVATTRPETLLGDVAVAVNPNDERYQHLIGQEVWLPLTDRKIPIIADDMVEIEFGTGCVKITPAHDFNDYLVGQRHQLPMINILTIDAALNENTPDAYRGLDRYVAREKMVKDLEAADLIEKIEPYALKVPRGDRSGAVVEPYLTWQWFIKTETLAKPAIEAVEKGDIRFVPENWSKTYFQWMNNIQDWCISRQLWWGHRIPAWYDDAGNIYVGDNEASIRKEHKLADNITLTQDNDVLDTWFSSALWPFATLGWPHNTDALKQFYPTQVLVTGFDIIFFWVARMIMMGLKFMGKVPFTEVYITGLIRDSEGHKMSKSKGNVLDPIDLIDGISLEALVEKRTQGLMQPAMAKKIEQATRKHFPDGIPAFGTDALRFTFCALASTGRDIRFDLGRVEGYRNFCNKIWNAARYVLMNTENEIPLNLPFSKGEMTKLGLADRWILSQLQHTIQQTHHYFSTYRFDLLAQTLYDFTWNTFCDWYLELSKPILTNPNVDQQGTRYTLVYTLETLLRLMHPLMPYITEEIWQRVAPLLKREGNTIMLQPYPVYNAEEIDKSAEEEIIWLQNIILGIRNIRGEMNISPSKRLSVLLRNGTQEDQKRLKRNQAYLCSLAKLDAVRWLSHDETAPPAATALAGQIEILIPLAGLINIDAEETRLHREIDKLKQELDKTKQKLANPNFADKAPAEVVQKDRQRVQEIQGAIDQLKAQLIKLSSLRTVDNTPLIEESHLQHREI